jgi:Kelch motif
LIGGMHGEFELVTNCRAVELRSMTWREIACPRFPRLNPQLVAVGERLYLVGGTAQHPTEGGGTELGPEPSIEVYEPTTNTWSTLVEAIPLEPRHLRAFAHRGRLVLFSTHDERPLAHVAVLTLPE